MKFPNAYVGVKKIYVSALISIIASIMVIFAAILALIAPTNEGVLGFVGLLSLIGGLALIVAFIIQIVGLNNAAKDEIQIKWALYAVAAAIIISILSSLFANFKNEAMIEISNYLKVLVNAVNVVSTYYVLKGIASLSDKLGDKEMNLQGESLATLVIILYVVSVVLGLFSTIFGATSIAWLAVLLSIISIIAAIINLVVGILTFIYYKKAVLMLEKPASNPE